MGKEPQGDSLTLSVSQVAKELGISKNTAYSLCKENSIPVIRLRRRILVSRQRLMELVNGQPKG